MGEEDQMEDVVTDSVVTKKRRQKQVAGIGPSNRPRKTKSSFKDVILPTSEAVGEEEEKEEEHKEEDPSDQTVGSDGGMSREEMEGGEVPKAAKIVEVEEDEEDDDDGQRDGQGTIMVEEEEIEENVDEKDHPPERFI
ncbi:hypothetical protein Dimus_016275 [Dionaea muscipula]